MKVVVAGLEGVSITFGRIVSLTLCNSVSEEMGGPRRGVGGEKSCLKFYGSPDDEPLKSYGLILSKK